MIVEMVEPMVSTLFRRPSAELDLILSKKDFMVCRRYIPPKKHQSGTYSPPNRLCKSENTSPMSGSLSSLAASATASTGSLNTSPGTQSPLSSPEVDSKDLFNADATKHNSQSKSSRLRHNVKCLKKKLSRKEHTSEPSLKRTLKVEMIDTLRKAKRDTCIPSYDQPDHKFNTSLRMLILKDGIFSAELSLDTLPLGNIRMSIRDYKVEIMVDRPQNKDKGERSQKASEPCYCGSIAIPIYVLPQSLKFSLNEERNILELKGMTKGYQYQRMTSSHTDILSRLGSSPVLRRFKRKPTGLNRFLSSEKEREVATSMPSLSMASYHRDRAYTR